MNAFLSTSPRFRHVARLAAIVVVWVSTVAGIAPAAEPDEAAVAGEVSYYRDVRPIFQARCQGCHQPAKSDGGLVMTSPADMLKGGESEEPAFVAGDPDESLLLMMISADEGAEPDMPKNADPLTADQVDLIRRWIAAGAEDDTPATASVVVDMEHPPVYELPPVVTSLDFSPDGTLLAVSGYHEVLLHKADGSELVARLVGLAERVESAVFSPDGKRLAVAGGSPCRFGEVQVWDVEARQLTLSVPVTYDTLYGASWSNDGTRVAFGCADNTLRVIEVEEGNQVLFQGAHSDWVLDTIFSTDDSSLVSVSRDFSMKLTTVATEQFMDNITSITPGALKGGLMTVDRHPNKDELLIGGSDGTPKIYQMYRTMDRKIGDDYNLIRGMDPMPGRIYSAEYSVDGTRVVVGSSNGRQGEIRVYEEADGKIVSKISTEGGIYAVAFHPDGKQIAAGGFDGHVRLYGADDGALIKDFVPVPLGPDRLAGAQAAAK